MSVIIDGMIPGPGGDNGGGGGGDVQSVFGRTGTVTAQAGDYNAEQVGADPGWGVRLQQSTGLVSSFTTIAGALAAALSGDTVIVGPGVWVESFTIPPGVSLVSISGPKRTTIAGAAATGSRVTLSSGSEFDGFTVNLPSDNVPAIAIDNVSGYRIGQVELKSLGGSGIGIRSTGVSIGEVKSINYLEGDCDVVLQCLNGAMIVWQVSNSLSAANIGAFVECSGGQLGIAQIGSFAPNVGDVIRASGGTLTLGTLEVEGGTNGIHITNDAASVFGRGVRIKSTSNKDILVDPVAVDSTLLLSSGELTRAKIEAPDMDRLVLSFIDPTPGDRGLVNFGQLSIGRFDRGYESVFGEGDSHVVGAETQRNTDLVGGTWTATTTESSSDTGSTFDLFSGVTADNAFYVGGDLPFPGIKAKVNTVIDLGAGGLEFQYWAGAGWNPLNYMVTDANGPYTQRAKEAFSAVGSEQIRFGDMAGWDLATLNGITKYWVRIVVSSDIAVVPVLEQVKLHTNRTELNADGFLEFYGKAEQLRSLGWHLKQQDDLQGFPPSNRSINYATDIFLTPFQNRYMGNAKDAAGGTLRIPFGVNTAKPLVFLIRYFMEGSNTGDVEIIFNTTTARLGEDVFSGTLPQLTESIILPQPGAERGLLKEFSVDVDISSLKPGDTLAFSIIRDALGGNLNDTNPNPFVVESQQWFGTFWR